MEKLEKMIEKIKPYLKNLWIWILLLSLVLIVIGLLIFNSCLLKDTKDQILQYSMLIVTSVGFLVAIYQLKISFNQYFDDLASKANNNLELKITIKNSDNYFHIRTQVINRCGEDRKIVNAFLLISVCLLT